MRDACDVVIIGAGHNGLTAAVILQQAGLRTVCLDAKLYAGGMASTVELFDGYHFEIAGWPETTVLIRFWLIAGLFVMLAIGVFVADFTRLAS